MLPHNPHCCDIRGMAEELQERVLGKGRRVVAIFELVCSVLEAAGQPLNLHANNAVSEQQDNFCFAVLRDERPQPAHPAICFKVGNSVRRARNASLLITTHMICADIKRFTAAETSAGSMTSGARYPASRATTGSPCSCRWTLTPTASPANSRSFEAP